MAMFPADDDVGDERLPGLDADPASTGEATATLPDAEPPSGEATATARNAAPSSFGDAFAALHDDGPKRHGAALRCSVELLAYYYAAQGRPNPAQAAIRMLVTDRYDILNTPRFGLYAPKGQAAAVVDAGLRIMDALNADSVADPVWVSGAADSTEAQRRADYADQARRGRWVMDVTGRHAILRDAQGRSVLAGSNINRVRLKGVPVVGFVMEQADQVQPVGAAAVGRAGRIDSDAAKNQVGSEAPRSINIYIEGLSVPGFERPVHDYVTRADPGATYFYQSETKEILEFIRKQPPGVKINLIGHSYGADTAAVVAARSERRIENLITIDPVSRKGAGSDEGPSYAKVKSNTNWWHNVNSASPRRSIDESIPAGNVLAWLGGAWEERQRKFTDSFVTATADHPNFSAMMGAQVNGMSGNQAVLRPDHPLVRGK